ncbi:sporulation integral membrane protein YlbJ [Virgibacillus sp. MSJ-26]|nr:sporulation integral membrane protein YlbJ [Virgibacillus sp. MSJ-26]
MFAGLTLFFAYSLIKYPDQALEASIRGLNSWWEVVFPSLLPFFITAELLLAFGVVHFVGVLFEPIMRPLFNVPGAGSFAWLMGMASGYPTGAKITVRLREEQQVSRAEAERLVTFTNASSPLFIFGAVSVGFFHDVKLGALLAISHYVGNTLVGICMRFHGASNKKKKNSKYKFSIKRAFKEMHRSRLNDKRPFGEILGDSVLNSIKTLVMVGGFIILFSVIIKLLYLTGITTAIAAILKYIFLLFSIPVEYAVPFISGFFEITTGIQMISQVQPDTLLITVMLTSFIIGFNGFSIQAQVGSIISHTDIRFSPYFISRILHGIFASILSALLYKPLYINRQAFDRDDLPVSGMVTDNFYSHIFRELSYYGPLITITFLGIATIILLRRHNY